LAAENIWARISEPESGVIERKPDGAGEKDFKETIVAFANSIPGGAEAVLFIGVADDGAILGCRGVESLQKTITRICTNECYPPIAHQIESRDFAGKLVVAVRVPHSDKSPHFSGHAFRRVGAQNIKADEAAYSDFIVARSSVGAKLVEYRGQIVDVRSYGKRIGSLKPEAIEQSGQFRIEACDPHTVTLVHVGTGEHLIEQVQNLSISQNAAGKFVLVTRP